MNNSFREGGLFNLLPHQQKLLELFFNNPSYRGLAVKWAPGSGKTSVILNLLARFLKENPDKNALFIAPASQFLKQVNEWLTSLGSKSEFMDRYRFRELEEVALNHEPIWKNGAVYNITAALAFEDDVATSLALVPWSLIVIEEACLVQPGNEMLQALLSRSPHARVVVISDPESSETSQLGIGPWLVSNLDRSEVISATGRKLSNNTSEAETVTLDFEYSQNEINLINSIFEIEKLLQDFGFPLSDTFSRYSRTRHYGKLVINTKPHSELSSRIRSSSLALEKILRLLRNCVVHQLDLKDSIFQVQIGTDSHATLFNLDAAKKETLLASISSSMEKLDLLNVDSKLNCLLQKLNQFREQRSLPGHVWIMTRYKETLRYLLAALLDDGFIVSALDQTPSYIELESKINKFRNSGGIMISTPDELVGMEFNVDLLIKYDNFDDDRLDKIYNRFQSFNNSLRLQILILRRQSSIGI